MKALEGILADLVRARKAQLEAAAPDYEYLEKVIEALPAPVAFASALQSHLGLTLICEVKRASPSKGALQPEADAVAVASTYARAGASAVSVLCESDYFGGSVDDLAKVHKTLPGVPLLCKDFIFTKGQLLQARAAGASSALLMASLLEPDELAELVAFARSLQLEPLVEVHSEAELEEALAASALVVGINNRNLRTLQVDLKVTFELAARVPEEKVLVSESGVSEPRQAHALRQSGVDALLVGTALMQHPAPEKLIKELLEAGRVERGRRR